MKKRIVYIFLTLCFFVSVLASCSKTAESAVRPSIRISGAWALYPMMVVWADEYMKIHDIDIEVTGGGAGKGISDVFSNQSDIGMVSRPLKQEELEQGAFYVAVAKDTVIAIINENNPVYEDIMDKGLSREDLRRIFLGEVSHWGELFNINIEDDEIVVYGRADSSGAASVWASYLGGYTEADLQNNSDSNVSGDQPMANSVQGDANAIGFSNMNYVYNAETGGYIKSIRPVPIDLNGNDVLDDDERFYDNRDVFLKNVTEGIYPSPPTREEYLVGNGPFEGHVKDFVKWILEGGQNFLEPNGYVGLVENEREKELEYLINGSRHAD
jgi:phosphate transport system substrate-binding protein